METNRQISSPLESRRPFNFLVSLENLKRHVLRYFFPRSFDFTSIHRNPAFFFSFCFFFWFGIHTAGSLFKRTNVRQLKGSRLSI